MQNRREKTVKLIAILSIFLTPHSIFAHGDHEHGSKPGKKGAKPSHMDHEESSWNFMAAVGVSVSKPLTEPPSSDPNKAGGTGLKLHGDEDHSSGGDSGSTEASYGPYAMVGIGYKLTQRFSLNLSEMVMLNGDGFGDPSMGLSYSTKLTKSLRGNLSLSATAPASKMSQDTYKITTVSFGGGPRLGLGKFSLGANASVSMSWYSKTIIVEEDQRKLSRSAAMLHGDDGDEGGGDHDMSAMEGTGNREFNRYSLKALVGYKLNNYFRFDSNAGISLVKKQFGDPYWNFDATILQVSFMIM